MKLTNFKEPILLIGPSCYKTYASKIYLEDPITVPLNRESTVLQLLRSSFFFSNIEYRNYCITQIYEILKIPNII